MKVTVTLLNKPDRNPHKQGRKFKIPQSPYCLFLHPQAYLSVTFSDMSLKMTQNTQDSEMPMLLLEFLPFSIEIPMLLLLYLLAFCIHLFTTNVPKVQPTDCL